MRSYSELLGAASATAGGGKKVYDIVAALAPPSSTAMTTSSGGASGAMSKVKGALPGLIGAAAGYMFMKKHRVIGALAGYALASNAMPVLHGGAERKRALGQLAVEGAGLYAAMKYGRRKPLRSVVAWLGGAAAGVVATSFVPGTPGADLVAKVRGR